MEKETNIENFSVVGKKKKKKKEPVLGPGFIDYVLRISQIESKYAIQYSESKEFQEYRNKLREETDRQLRENIFKKIFRFFFG